MTDLTQLEAKVGEVLGLAQAAKESTQKVKQLAQKEKKRELVRTLTEMGQEASETAKRLQQIAGSFQGKKSAISEKARETKDKAAKMRDTYLDDDADALDGFEFLTMAEAGEVGHWTVVEKLNQEAKHRELRELVRWVKPIQRRHFQQAIDGSVMLAQAEDPNEPA